MIGLDGGEGQGRFVSLGGGRGYQFGAQGGTEQDDRYVRSGMYGSFLSGAVSRRQNVVGRGRRSNVDRTRVLIQGSAHSRNGYRIGIFHHPVQG